MELTDCQDKLSKKCKAIENKERNKKINKQMSRKKDVQTKNNEKVCNITQVFHIGRQHNKNSYNPG